MRPNLPMPSTCPKWYVLVISKHKKIDYRVYMLFTYLFRWQLLSNLILKSLGFQDVFCRGLNEYVFNIRDDVK